MDTSRFDHFTRSLSAGSSRRTVLAGLLAGLLTPGLSEAATAADRHKGKSRGNDKRNRRRKTTAQAVPARCFGSGSCIPGTGAYLAKCDFTDSNALENVNCTSCNLSDSSLLRADASGANFTKANLSKACLVDADLTGATIAASTNLLGAVFCRTTMPNGSINNSGCTKGTACCKTCIEAGNTCGAGIAGSCCGQGPCCNNVCCAAGETCCNGQCQALITCQSLSRTCGTALDACGGTLNCGSCGTGSTPSCTNGTCTTCEAKCPVNCLRCYNFVDGNTICGNSLDALECTMSCTSHADCPASAPYCTTSRTLRETNSTSTVAVLCANPALTAVCTKPQPCSP